jgi:hypothetical protein
VVNYLPKEWWSVFDDWEPTRASTDKEKEDIEFTYSELEGLGEKVDSIPDSSPSRLEWLDQKRKLKEPLDRKQRHIVKVFNRVMCLSGHEDVKKQFLSIKARIEAGKARSEDLKALKPNLLILGGPETGTYTTPTEKSQLITYNDVIQSRKRSQGSMRSFCLVLTLFPVPPVASWTETNLGGHQSRTITDMRRPNHLQRQVLLRIIQLSVPKLSSSIEAARGWGFLPV